MMKCNKSATSGAGIEVSVSCGRRRKRNGKGGRFGAERGREEGRGSQPHLQLIATNSAVEITNCISGLAAQRRVRSVCNDKAYRGNDITASPAPSPSLTHPLTIFYDRLCVNVSVFLLFLLCCFFL